MRQSLVLGVAFLALLLRADASYCLSQDSNGKSPAGFQPTVTNVALADYMGVLQTVQVQVGPDTLPFIFDTGGGLTILTPEVADRLGCEPYGRVTGFRMDGERLDLERCGETTLNVAGLPLRIETGVFDFMSLLPGGWPEVGGLVSLHTFRDKALTLSLASNSLTVETESSLKERIAGMKSLSARLNNQCGGACVDLFVEVRTQRGSIWLGLDTGNSGPVLLAPHACKQLGLDCEMNEEGSDDRGASLGEITLDFVGLGPIQVTAKMTDMIYDGLINADTVRKLVLTMDLRTGEVWGTVREP